MMKRWMWAMILCAFMMASCAQAEGVEPDDDFFDRGREAIMMLAEGDVDGALAELDFSFDVGSGLSEEDFRGFVSNSFSLMDSGAVQCNIAVCWLDDGGRWHLGLPVVEPVAGDIEVLVLDSWDLESFSGYDAMTWGELLDEVAESWAFYWNEEYLPAAPVLMADE